MRTLAWAALLLLSAHGADAAVHLLPYDGPITPVAAEYLVEGIEDAEAQDAACVVILLDTPGGLDSSMRLIVKKELAAAVPVVVFVAPSGSRAASAGAFITLAAHVAAMAPGTNIGSASPVSMGGGQMDSTMTKKVTHDAAAYIESIARQRGRNVDLARSFVEEAENLSAQAARGEGVVDLVVPTVEALLDSLDGRMVEVEGVERSLATAGSEIREFPMGWRLRLLKALADPSVAYLLMLVGIYGIFFELSNPGALAPGILGGICLLLALFAFQSLPVNYAGVGLLLLGVVLLILEVKVTSFGALTLGGLTAMVLGSLLLFDSPGDWARLSLKVVLPAVAAFGGFFLLCVWLVVRTQRRPPVSGRAALVGERGRVVVPLAGGGAVGKVVFHGEVWNAVSEQALPEGATVEILEVEGRTVRVRALSGS
jgi:membrane-bound serine protease (ClpP class)